MLGYQTAAGIPSGSMCNPAQAMELRGALRTQGAPWHFCCSTSVTGTAVGSELKSKLKQGFRPFLPKSRLISQLRYQLKLGTSPHSVAEFVIFLEWWW